MMTLDDMRQVLDRISYRDWYLTAHPNREFGYLQVSFVALDAATAEISVQKGRKWQLSPHMTVSEIVQTALLAILTAEEHEVREQFLYRGRPVFGPHRDVEALAAAPLPHDARQPVPSPAMGPAAYLDV